jgi:hypothetical protein
MADHNQCQAMLGDLPCHVPRSNKRHMRVPEEHSNGSTQWDDDAPGAAPHPVSREVEHYRKVVSTLRTHLAFPGSKEDGDCAACDIEGFPVPYPCSALTQAGVQ